MALAALGCRGNDEGDETGGGGTGTIPSVILDGGGEAAVAPDGSGACEDPNCNYQTGAPCASGTTCRPSVVGGGVEPSCQPTGSAALGESCSAWDDCGESAICADGTCRRLCCEGDWSVCPAGEGCYRRFDLALDGGTEPTGASVCFPVGECDALDPESCPPGRACQIVDPRGSVACIPAGSGTVGDPCPCAAGFVCVGKPGQGRCRRLCRAVEGGGEPSCPAAEGVCVHFWRDPPGVGECTAVQ